MRRQIVLLFSFVLSLSIAARATAQPTLSITPIEVPPGGSVTVVITGNPGQAWGVGGSFSGSGLTYGGAALALGTDAVALGFGVFDGSGTATLTFKPPIGPTTPLYYVQAIAAADMSFAGAQPTQSITLRPAGIFTNTPVLPQGLSAGHARIVGVAEPVDDSDAATKAYVDSVGGAANGGAIDDARLSSNIPRLNAANFFSGLATFAGGLSAANARIQNVGAPVQPMDAVNRLYVDTTFVKLSSNSAFTDGGFYFGGTLGVGAIPASGGGVRVQWYPNKAAFRAGGLDMAGTQWDDVNTGFYSFASGHNTIAKGQSSIAMGDLVTVTGTSAVGLGHSNTVDGSVAFASGASNVSSGFASTAMGFGSQALGQGSAAIGFRAASCADYSIALGQRVSSSSAPTTFSPCAGTAHLGVFIFGDGSTTAHFASMANNEFAARATGGFRFRTNVTLTTGCNLPAGSGVFACSSDRNLKTGFTDLDGEDVLRKVAAIPVTQWRFTDEATGATHVGPMAQDFHAAFGLGDTDTMIGYTDINGINMRAIQALDVRTRELQAAQDRVRQLEERMATLEAAVEALIRVRQ